MEAEETGIPDESSALQSILKGHLSVEQFFASVWQTSCAIFPQSESTSDAVEGNANSTPVFEGLIENSWNVLIQLLEVSSKRSEPSGGSKIPSAAEFIDNEKDSIFLPLLFKNKAILSYDDRAIYNHSLFAAYLDGCSVVVNHADRISPTIAQLCNDLQRSFPHVYANIYLTPPASQTAPPHADDRDVFVIQLMGSKEWTVYQRIPVPYPYPNEQVGKDGVEVPPSITNGPIMIQRILRPGDVLVRLTLILY